MNQVLKDIKGPFWLLASNKEFVFEILQNHKDPNFSHIGIDAGNWRHGYCWELSLNLSVTFD